MQADRLVGCSHVLAEVCRKTEVSTIPVTQPVRESHISRDTGGGMTLFFPTLQLQHLQVLTHPSRPMTRLQQDMAGCMLSSATLSQVAPFMQHLQITAETPQNTVLSTL